MAKKKKKILKDKPPYSFPLGFQRFIKEWFNELVDVKFFEDYKLSFKFSKWDELNPHNGKMTSMEIDMSEAYLDAEVKIFPECHRKYVQHGPAKIVEDVIIHELSHTVVVTLAELARERYVTDEEISKQEEKMTERYARLVYYYLKKEGYLIDL